VPWQTLKPERAVSNSPVLTVLKDGSVLAGGDITKADTYDLTFKTTAQNITAILPEALPPESPPAGGPGMAPMARRVQAHGGRIEGSDRSRDQGRTPEKFAWLEAHGVTLHPQDGSGVTRADQTVVATGAIEDTVPDIGAARRAGARIVTRPELLSQLFNAAPASIGVAGTSGKSTITGMIAWILHQAGRAPTVMNGAVMKNFADADHPFASALIGGPDLFVSEVDESDGSIARYDPTVAVVSNISLDHKSMEELRDLFGGFTGRAAKAVLNLDNVETQALAQSLPADKVITFALGEESATLNAHDLEPMPTGMRFTLTELGGARHAVVLNVPGAHNVANALAAPRARRHIRMPQSETVPPAGAVARLRRAYLCSSAASSAAPSAP